MDKSNPNIVSFFLDNNQKESRESLRCRFRHS